MTFPSFLKFSLLYVQPGAAEISQLPSTRFVSNKDLTRRTIVFALIGAVLLLGSCATKHRQEEALRNTLKLFRAVLSSFVLDHNRGPDSLQELVSAGYLKQLPVDPMTGRRDTWITVVQPRDLKNPNSGTEVVELHSGSPRIGSNGLPYSSW